jgi:hypothetical protein
VCHFDKWITCDSSDAKVAPFSTYELLATLPLEGRKYSGS